MSEYIYPAVFHPNEDGSYTIIYPDLDGCISEGKDLSNAMYMAQAALTQWMEYLTDKKEGIPAPSAIRDIVVEGSEFVNFVKAEVKDTRAIRRTVSIPKWMDEQVTAAGISLSRVLQDALRERLAAR